MMEMVRIGGVIVELCLCRPRHSAIIRETCVNVGVCRRGILIGVAGVQSSAMGTAGCGGNHRIRNDATNVLWRNRDEERGGVQTIRSDDVLRTKGSTAVRGTRN